MAQHTDPVRILFVCLGNICRSPMAEGAMAMLVHQKNLSVELDSAGTGGWHIGRAPDPRAQSVALAHGCDISGLRARQVQGEDFDRFDHIIAMDCDNLSDLQALRPGSSRAQLSLLLDYPGGEKGRVVADPYYGGERDFQQAWSDVMHGARGLVCTITGDAAA